MPIPFDQIIDAVHAGTVDAGLLIHEGQLLFPQMGLHSRGGPRPVVAGNHEAASAARRQCRAPRARRRKLAQRISRAIRESVAYALEHREEALNYALQFARDMDTDLADKFVGMYVNKWTLGYGERGRAAVQELLDRGVQAGLLPGPVKAEF